jgi:hypothetical protein
MADKFSWSRRPNTHAERTEVIGFVAARDVAALGPLVTAQLDPGYREAEARYLADSAVHDDAWAQAEWTGAEVAAADDAVRTAFRRWQASVEGRLVTRIAGRLAPVLGNRTPARFLAAAVSDKVEVFPRLFAYVSRFPELVGDPAAYAGLQDAADTLAVARLLNDDALVARARAVRVLAETSRTFDRQYGMLVKTILLVDPAGVGADVPRFRRTARVEAAAGVAAEVPVETTPALTVVGEGFVADEAEAEGEAEAA